MLTNPPYSGAYTQEAFDVILTAAAFDQVVSLLLLDQAIFLLKSNQHPENFCLKNPSAVVTALPLYNINTVYVETESLTECGLRLEQLMSPVTEINRTELGGFCKQFDLVLGA